MSRNYNEQVIVANSAKLQYCADAINSIQTELN